MSAKTALTPDVPWPGAAPYGTADRAFFHGRKRETEELLRLIQRDVITLVMGPAGVGKTSLIHAGLLPALAESEWLPVVPKLDWSATPPASNAPDVNPAAAVSLDNPLSRTLIEALIAASGERKFSAPEPQPGETLWEYFHRAGNRWWSSRQRVVTPIIIIDGFESVFTTATQNATAERQAAGFLKELSQLAANRPPQRFATRLENGSVSEAAYDFEPVPLRIIFVLRDEFAAQLTQLRAWFPTLRRSELRVEPFTISQARDVLLRGSMQANLMTEPALDAIVSRLSTDRPAASEILPATLSAMAHELAVARKKLGVKVITPEFLPKRGSQPAASSPPPSSEPSSPPISEPEELREKLAESEKRRRGSQRLGLAALFLALAAVATPFVREQWTSKKSPSFETSPVASRHTTDLPSPSPAPPTPIPDERPVTPDSPFSIAAPDFLPSVPGTPSPSPGANPSEPFPPKPPVEPLPEEPAPHPEKTPPQPAPPPAESNALLPEPPAATPSPVASPRPTTTPNPASALSPEAQRQIDAATADRKEQQQRREFLRKQQENRRTKEGNAR